MRWLLLVAACSSSQTKSATSDTTPIGNTAPAPEPKRVAVAGRQLALEWNVTPEQASTTLSL